LAYARPQPLEKRHARDGFDCGKPELNDWLQRHALVSQASDSAQVYVTTEPGSDVVAGYYALAAAQVGYEDALERVRKGQPRHRPIPAVLLARLAVDLQHQGRGVGRSLLQDALGRALAAAEAIGARAVLVHAKDDEARAWYERYGFAPSPTDPLHLLLLMKDIRATLEDVHG
jgi:GNAT superfamily N-acetyltransferase